MQTIKRKKLFLISIVIIIMLVITFVLLYSFQIIPHKAYDNKYFGITSYISSMDQDHDGIDDQTDILQNVRNYIKTKPKYESKYYASGYPHDEYGVCTDVIAQGLLHAGYDLMELVNEDMLQHIELYGNQVVDKKIDFRRVKNLFVYFEHHALSLTLDLSKIEDWQGGDIVVYKKHIALVSDKRNWKGIPFIIHHSNPYQLR